MSFSHSTSFAGVVGLSTGGGSGGLLPPDGEVDGHDAHAASVRAATTVAVQRMATLRQEAVPAAVVPEGPGSALKLPPKAAQSTRARGSCGCRPARARTA